MRHPTLCVLAAVGLLAGGAKASTADPEAQARDATDWIVEEQVYPGFRAVIAQGGETVFERNEGYADIDQGVAVGSEHRFRVFSIAKTFAAAAALKLVEASALELHAPISDYIDGLPAHLRSLTTHQLLTHSSGMRHYRSGEWLSVSYRSCQRPQEALRDFINDPLIAEPGAGYNYSSYGYVLLSHLIEIASGKPFLVYMREEIFRPAGMHATALEGYDVGGGLRVIQYMTTTTTTSGYRPVDPEVNASCKFGAGGFVSTPDDLVRFGAALVSGQLLSSESLDLMFTSYFEWGGGGPAYGYGVTPGLPPVPSELPQGVTPADIPDLVNSLFARFAGHEFGDVVTNNGSAVGSYALLVMYPETRTVGALVSNARGRAGADALIAFTAATAAYGRN